MKKKDILNFIVRGDEIEYQSEVKKCNEIKGQIEYLLENFDNFELFSRYLLMTRTRLSGERVLSDILEDYPIYHFCIGLALKKKNNGTKEPSINEGEALVWLLQSFYETYLKVSLLQSILSKNIDADLIHLSRQQYLINQTNKERYPFQTKELLQETFRFLNDYFEFHIGFNIDDAIEFVEKIVNHFNKLVHERIERGRQARVSGKECSDEVINILFKNSRTLIEIDVDSFCHTNEIPVKKFQRYLFLLSCSFGTGDPTYTDPIDDNVINQKPIIKYQSKYYCPDPDLLFSNLQEIFEGLLDDERRKNSKIWESYKDRKSEFTETKVKEYLLRVFSKNDVKNKLFYDYLGKRQETDHIVTYCKNCLIVEDKSGRYSLSAKRGGILRIKSDLGKLISKSFEQGLTCRDYIKSTKIASFESEKKGDIILEISYEHLKTHFLIINVTLEHLYSFSNSLKILDSLNLFQNDEYPWSVSLFELDLITRSIRSPAIFVHYAESRIKSQKEKYSFFAFDEISFLSYYLENGNFIIYPKNGKIPDLTLSPDYIKPFDLHYTHGDASPKLQIEDEILKIINDLEMLRPDHLTRITNAILDLPHHLRKLLIKEIQDACFETSTDGKLSHTSIYNNILNTGFTVFAQIGRNNLQTKLSDYCWLKKYQCKAKCWVGFGIDILENKKYFAHEIICFESEWKYDKDLENLLTSALKCGFIEDYASGEHFSE